MREIARLLISRGLRWAYGHDWTQTSIDRPDDPGAALLAQRDLQSAVAADLFVMLPFDPLTAGCHVELGARVGVGKEAHIIREDGTKWHLFHSLPGVIEHSSVDEFVLFALGA